MSDITDDSLIKNIQQKEDVIIYAVWNLCFPKGLCLCLSDESDVLIFLTVNKSHLQKTNSILTRTVRIKVNIADIKTVKTVAMCDIYIAHVG